MKCLCGHSELYHRNGPAVSVSCEYPNCECKKFRKVEEMQNPDIIELVRLEVSKQVASASGPTYSIDEWDFQVAMASTYPGPGWLFTAAIGGPSGQVYIVWRHLRSTLPASKIIVRIPDDK